MIHQNKWIKNINLNMAYKKLKNYMVWLNIIEYKIEKLEKSVEDAL